MKYGSENLVLIRSSCGKLSWEVVFVDHIEWALDYLQLESGVCVSGLEAITLIKSGSIISGLDYD